MCLETRVKTVRCEEGDLKVCTTREPEPCLGRGRVGSLDRLRMTERCRSILQ